MTKIILTIAITTAIGFFTGKYFYSSYKERRQYYSALTEFTGALESNLSFRQEKLSDVVDEFAKKTNAVFAEQLKNFGDYIAGRGEFIITCSAARKDGGLAESFFKNIGTVDIFTQKEALKSYKTQFDERLKICAAEEKNKGMMMLKVFTLAGLAAGILLV